MCVLEHNPFYESSDSPSATQCVFLTPDVKTQQTLSQVRSDQISVPLYVC